MKNFFKHLWVDFQLILQVMRKGVFTRDHILMFLLFFVIILFILQWLFNLEQLGYVMFEETSLGFAQKLDFLIDAFFNIFKQWDNIVPISMILIAFLQAAALVLFLQLKKQSKGASAKTSVASMSVGLIGAGCVACGGSILTPLLGAVAANISVVFAERISHTLLILAVVLSYRALSKIAFVYASSVVE